MQGNGETGKFERVVPAGKENGEVDFAAGKLVGSRSQMREVSFELIVTLAERIGSMLAKMDQMCDACKELKVVSNNTRDGVKRLVEIRELEIRLKEEKEKREREGRELAKIEESKKADRKLQRFTTMVGLLANERFLKFLFYLIVFLAAVAILGEKAFNLQFFTGLAGAP